jgi:hypothetical protein
LLSLERVSEEVAVQLESIHGALDAKDLVVRDSDVIAAA